MINDKLKKNIDNTVNILRRYRDNAIERDKPDAKRDIETVMHTVQDLSRLVFDEKPRPAYKEMLKKLIDSIDLMNLNMGGNHRYMLNHKSHKIITEAKILFREE